MISVSGKLTPHALTLITTWPRFGVSGSISSITRLSGGPYALQMTALMMRLPPALTVLCQRGRSRRGARADVHAAARKPFVVEEDLEAGLRECGEILLPSKQTQLMALGEVLDARRRRHQVVKVQDGDVTLH